MSLAGGAIHLLLERSSDHRDLNDADPGEWDHLTMVHPRLKGVKRHRSSKTRHIVRQVEMLHRPLPLW